MESIESTVKLLEETGLVSADKLRAVASASPPPADAAALLTLLTEQGSLTKFQAQQVTTGRAKTLVFGSYVMLDRMPGAGPLFKARHRRVQRFVTIRPLPPTLFSDPARKAVVLREIETSGQLQHANVVAVQDVDEVAGAYYVVADFVDGGELASFVKQKGKLSVEEACSYAAHAAAGLAQAQALGLVHRDVRPETLVIDRNGTVKVLGFGFTPPPAGADFATEGKADVAAIGRMLYRLITGADVPVGATPLSIAADIRSDVSPAVNAYLARLTATQPGDRPSMAEAATAIKSPGTLPMPMPEPEPFVFDDVPETDAMSAFEPVLSAPVAALTPAATPEVATAAMQPAPLAGDTTQAITNDFAATAAWTAPPLFAPTPAAPASVGATISVGTPPAIGMPPAAAPTEQLSEVMPVADDESSPFASLSAAAAPSGFAGFDASAPTTMASTTRTAAARKPTKPLKIGKWEVDPKFLTPPYLIGAGSGAVVLLIVLVAMMVGGGSSEKPVKAKVIPVVPPRNAAAASKSPAVDVNALFQLPPSAIGAPPAPAAQPSAKRNR